MDSSLSSSNLNVKEFLRPLLLGLEEEDLDELAQAAALRLFSPGTVICHEGEPGDAVYFVVEGQVDILKRLDDENERFLHSLRSGEIFGEMAIVQESVRTATVRTAEPTAVLEIAKDPFLAVLGRSPSLGIRILVRMTNRLRDTDQKAISELRQVNQELTQALHQLARLDRTKADFIRLSAHELRTPVAALLGYAQMMKNNPLVQANPQLSELVHGVVTGTARLHRVFNSILDVSRVMTGGMEIHRSPVSIPVILEGIFIEFQQALEDRGLTLERVGIKGLPICAGEPDLLYKVFYHLVSNGIKYTPDGGRIAVIGRTVDLPDLGLCIEVAVEDTGIGIAPQDLDLIFEKFYRTGEVELHSSGTTKFKGGGPGLGLAIARGGVEAHGGRIWAESAGYDEEACPGSRFIVQLPFVEVGQEPVAAPSESSSSATTPNDSFSGG